MNPACEQVLDAGLDELGLVAPAEQRDRLLALVALLHKWNRAYNLTAVREPVAMVQRHLLDSLADHRVLTGVLAGLSVNFDSTDETAVFDDTDSGLRILDHALSVTAHTHYTL